MYMCRIDRPVIDFSVMGVVQRLGNLLYDGDDFIGVDRFGAVLEQRCQRCAGNMFGYDVASAGRGTLTADFENLFNVSVPQ